MIYFNIPSFVGNEIEYMRQAIQNQKNVEMLLFCRCS